MKKNRFAAYAVSGLLAVSMLVTGCSSGEAEIQEQTEDVIEASFADGEGTEENPLVIETAEQLDLVHEDLDGHYVLGADIDLSEYDSFDPIGTFVPISEEDPETALAEAAFTGSFDGAGYKISNVNIDAPDLMGTGLFGTVSGEGSAVKNLEVENITVNGGMYTGGIVGFADWDASIDSLILSGDNSITGTFLIGGVVGAAHCPLIINCAATADIILNGDGAQGAGIIVGGAEVCSLENCRALGGSVTATGTSSLSIGALAGCAHESEYVKNCTAENITVIAPEGSYMIGGLVGHAGASEENVTEISGCIVKNVTINAADSAERIGMIVGSGFYGDVYKEYYPEPLAFSVTDCTAEGAVNGGRLVGGIAGYTYNNSTVENCVSNITVNGEASDIQIGGTLETAGLDTLN